MATLVTPVPVGARRWWAVGALSLAVLAVGLDLTVLSLALPTLATDLHASTARFFLARSSQIAVVIWLPVTVASVVATCVIRFGNTRCAQPLSCPRS